jgi:hypothetical protein
LIVQQLNCPTISVLVVEVVGEFDSRLTVRQVDFFVARGKSLYNLEYNWEWTQYVEGYISINKGASK